LTSLRRLRSASAGTAPRSLRTQ